MSASPENILCVDDEAFMRDLMAMALQGQGHRVETAEDGRDGWKKLSADLSRFTLVITDVRMPKLDGVGFVKLLREANFSGRIVVFSGSLTDDVVASFRALGVDSFVRKGSSLDELVAAVNQSV